MLHGRGTTRNSGHRGRIDGRSRHGHRADRFIVGAANQTKVSTLHMSASVRGHSQGCHKGERKLVKVKHDVSIRQGVLRVLIITNDFLRDLTTSRKSVV